MGAPGTLHLRKTNRYYLNRKGPRHQGAQRTRSGLSGDRIRWPCHYGNSVSMLVRQEGSGWAQILRKTESHKNWLKPAKIKMVLSMVWSLTSSSLCLHCNTKIHSPLSMTGAVIVPRLTIDGQKVKGVGFHLLTTQKPIKRPCWWKGTFALFWMLVCVLGGG